MEKRIIILVIISIVVWSCGPHKSEKMDGEEDQVGTVISDSTPEDVTKTDQQILHVEHEEDNSYPWYDTRYTGHWMNKAYMNKLIEIFKTDTTISLYDYVAGLDQCSGKLLVIDIEGCAKDNIFYLKNAGCNDNYISKSNFGVDKETPFTLKNVYTGKSYNFDGDGFNELTINGEVFIKEYSLSSIEEILSGTYIYYDDANRLIDTVRYRGGRFEKSDTLSQMNLIDITSINSSHEQPALPHSDFVYVRFYTGELVTGETVDDLGRGTGIFETGPATWDVHFNIKRTLQGFELHNAYDPNKNKLLKSGLVYKFKKIREFESRRRRE